MTVIRKVPVGGSKKKVLREEEGEDGARGV